MTSSPPSSWSRRRSVLLASVLVLGAGCGLGEHSEQLEPVGDSSQELSACNFAVTRNSYVGQDWWGTLTVVNRSSSTVTSVQIAFDVPSGVSCDHATTGWSYTQSGTTCRYSSGRRILAGSSLTLNYSTNSQAFSSVTNVKVGSATCSSSTPPATTSSPSTPTTGTSTTPTPSRTANLTYFESYPDPGSEECIAYNGCTWAGQFAALSGKQPESWVMANNIVAVHSKDFAKYRLKTLRIRQGSRQIDAKVYDMCSDSDCNGCCTANSRQTGFLIDLEKHTAERFGSTSGVVEWTCLDCP